MEALTRLVSDSLARHGFNRPPDPRRLQWSRWFLCDSLHSLLVVPSKPGIFAIAEEICGAGDAFAHSGSHDARDWESKDRENKDREGHDLSRAINPCDANAALAAEVSASKRMLAVVQFSEDDDMAFTLDRMFTRPNPMRDRLASGHCFLRFVVIEDEDQRRNICNALNQWLLSSAEKASGIPAGFSSSLEFTSGAQTDAPCSAVHLSSEANKNLHCPQPFPAGF